MEDRPGWMPPDVLPEYRDPSPAEQRHVPLGCSPELWPEEQMHQGSPVRAQPGSRKVTAEHQNQSPRARVSAGSCPQSPAMHHPELYQPAARDKGSQRDTTFIQILASF